MTSLKDLISKDMEVFFNIDEFAEPHKINGRSVRIIKDDDKLEKLLSSDNFGIAGAEILYFAKVEDFKEKPKIGELQNFDDDFYLVVNVKEDYGVYEIVLRGSEG